MKRRWGWRQRAAGHRANYDEVKGVVAHNSVHHSKQYPSPITVTVVPRQGSTR
jgi:hypothetical protein